MDEAVRVRVRQRLGYVGGDAERVSERELRLLSQAYLKGAALDMGHDVVQQSFDRSRLEERENVRMLELRLDLDLAEETIGGHRADELGLEDLEGDVALILQISGEKDDRHPPPADLALDRVAIG
jgi:hypothetical protein